MAKQIVFHSYNRILHSNGNKPTTAAFNTNYSQKCLLKETKYLRIHTELFHLHESKKQTNKQTTVVTEEVWVGKLLGKARNDYH